jgi:hypothetical protein
VGPPPHRVETDMADALDYRPSFGAVHYKHRAHFDLRRALMVVPPMMIAALLIGAVYGVVQDRIEQILFKGVALLAAGVAVGIIAVPTNRWARVRTPAAATLIACALGFAALYGSWVAWIFVVLRRLGTPVNSSTVWYLVSRPWVLWSLIKMINAVGVWSYHDRAVHGVDLTIVWIIEALGLILIPVLFATQTEMGEVDKPFCDKCRAFLVRKSGLARFAGDDHDRDADTIAHIEARDFDWLLSLGPPADEDAPYISMELLRCPKCGETNTLSLRRRMLIVNAQHQLVAHAEPLIERVLITAEQAEQVIALKDRLPKPAEPVQSSPTSSSSPEEDA